jgi:hypothetical protein
VQRRAQRPHQDLAGGIAPLPPVAIEKEVGVLAEVALMLPVLREQFIRSDSLPVLRGGVVLLIEPDRAYPPPDTEDRISIWRSSPLSCNALSTPMLQTAERILPPTCQTQRRRGLITVELLSGRYSSNSLLLTCSAASVLPSTPWGDDLPSTHDGQVGTGGEPEQRARRRPRGV